MNKPNGNIMYGGDGSMKIVTIVRTLNEEANIEQFCKSHSFSDLILVADGGSSDKTVEYAEKFDNVKVRAFTERVELENGYWCNPDWKHRNFMIDWAKEEGADWIIMDDADTNPNYLLARYAREIFELSDYNYVQAVQLYMWGKEHYLPKMSQLNAGEFQPGLWAWKASANLRTAGEIPHYYFVYGNSTDMIDFVTKKSTNLLPPYCRLHNNCPDVETTNRKLKYYRESGLMPGIRHPFEYGGALEPLPEWAKL